MAKNEDRLDTWKEIAEYLNKDVRTVIRWEKERGLPVHRAPGVKRSAVYAWPSEIDLWLAGAAKAQFEGSGPAALTVSAAPVPVVSRSQKSWAMIGATVSVVVLVAGLSAFRLSQERPRLGEPVQITNDGREKGGAATSEDSFFNTSVDNGRTTIRRIELKSGQSSVLKAPFRNFDLLDASLDGSKLLVMQLLSAECLGPLWIVPTNGDPPVRLTGLCGSAAWSPDGSKLAYAPGREVYLAKPDGTGPRKIATLPCRSFHLRWSPTGKYLRLLLDNASRDRLWDVPLDGSAPHLVSPGWSGALDQESAGDWTPDGRFFVFPAFHSGKSSLWAIHESGGLFSRPDRRPFRLMPSLNGVVQPTMSRDGKKLFAAFTSPERGELNVFEPSLRQFVTYPDPHGLSAAQTSFSPDGKQVAYVTHPEMTLWKMNVDGSNRKELAQRAALPQWSPDGRWIAFMGWNKEPNTPTKIRVISPDGSSMRQPVSSPEWQGAPNWTPDGGGLIFGENGPVSPIPATACLHRFDFKSGVTSDLPGSAGL